MALFLDASFLIALADPKDPWHERALELLPKVERRRPWHTHALSVAEVVAKVGSARGGKAAREVYYAVRDDSVLHFPLLDHLDESMRLVVRYDGGLSLSDAYALHVMAAEGIDAIASFDTDFDGKGVQRLC